MKIYINDDFDDVSISFKIHNPDWIFNKLPCLANYPHGVENVAKPPFTNMRPYIEIDDVEQLFKLVEYISDINYWYRVVVEPFGQICIYEDEITYE